MHSLEEGKVLVEALEGWELAQRLGRQEGREEERTNTKRKLQSICYRMDLMYIS